MKYLIILIILAGTCFAINSNPKEFPYYEYDPNSVIIDADTVTVTVTIKIKKNQARALKYLDLDFIDILQKSTIGRLLNKYIKEAKAKIVESYTVDELKAKTKE